MKAKTRIIRDKMIITKEQGKKLERESTRWRMNKHDSNAAISLTFIALAIALGFYFMISVDFEKLKAEDIARNKLNSNIIENEDDALITGLISFPTGKAISQVYVLETFYNVTCRVDLRPSWNLVSMPCILDNLSVGYAFNDTQNKIVSVHYFNTSEIPDNWKTYVPSAESFAMSDLTEYSEHSGYWINAEDSTSIVIIGTINLPNILELKRGWNLVSWSSNETKNITIALSQISGKYASVHAYFANDTLDPWKVYNPSINPALNDLRYMQPYVGYWINMTQNASLKVI